ADSSREPRKGEPPKASREAPATVPDEPPATKCRMSFRDKHALETLPKTIAALQAEANALQAKLDDPQFYARDRAAFEQVATKLGDLRTQIAAAEEQWLELEMQREALGGGLPALPPTLFRDREKNSDLILRSSAVATWRAHCVSKDGGESGACGHPSRRISVGSAD